MKKRIKENRVSKTLDPEIIIEIIILIIAIVLSILGGVFIYYADDILDNITDNIEPEKTLIYSAYSWPYSADVPGKEVLASFALERRSKGGENYFHCLKKKDGGVTSFDIPAERSVIHSISDNGKQPYVTFQNGTYSIYLPKDATIVDASKDE